ncbi:DUF3298 and DUF4163 domain-containing protein [Parabacteroides sp. PF5-6]|uniref:DUF3298 and DUF4163 domain-containing protein n=1 Tax=Parabacteroides sp. PF5-6 TaxID=1742403 RepID=UPI002405B025|nr:DUF3298 and DUF4163 domain-containing protein [Parabacteroides sp. PF5-6]MDF9829100.1 hypothetical protein [Parabacteroides sp. PF5-6]
MKVQLYKGLSVLLAVGFMLSGCKTEVKKGQKNDIQFTTLKKEEAYHLLENAENPNCDLQLNFTFPTKFANKEILDKVQKLFTFSYFGETYDMYSPQEAVNEYVESYLEMYKELEEDYKEDLKNADTSPVGAWYGYYETSNNEIMFNADNLISYTVTFENYTGGAHPAHSVTNHVIDLTRGEFITEAEIFIPGFETSLAQMLVDAIAEQNDLEDPKELENMGYFSIDEIYPNGNFLIDGQGITYSFNEYEIAAYVIGVTSVHFPFEKIKHLLQPESPIAILLQ